AEITKQVRRLGILDLLLNRTDVVRDMPVCGKDVGESVQVIVKEKTAERKSEQRCTAYRRSRGFVDKQARAFVVIERHHFIREITDHQAESSRAIIVRSVHTHARPGDSGFAESDTGSHCIVDEGTITVVAIKLIRLRVVGYEQVWLAVVVVIDHCNAKRFCRSV